MQKTPLQEDVADEDAPGVQDQHGALKAQLDAFEAKYMQEHDGRPPRLPEEWGDAWNDHKRYVTREIARLHAVLRHAAMEQRGPPLRSVY